MELARLILVTGKGGTGRSTVAAALALALARHRPTTLVDLDQRGWAARMLGIEERGGASGVAVADGARSRGMAAEDARAGLDAVGLSARGELEAFIDRIVPIKALARRMLKSRTFGYVSAALPGLEAFLMLDRLRIIADQAAHEDRYAVVDAPATGSALELLAVPGALKRIAPFGTLHRLAVGVERMLGDPSVFAVMLTLTPHELALREALEASDTLRGRLGVRVAAAVINRAPRPLFERGEIDALAAIDAECERLARWRDGAGDFEARARREANRAGLRAVELPMLFSMALGAAELEALSHALWAALRPTPPASTPSEARRAIVPRRSSVGGRLRGAPRHPGGRQ